MNTEDLIKTMDICSVVSNKGLKGSGLSAGDVVLVIGARVLPEKRSDPYLNRTYVLTIKFDENEEIMMPKEDNDNMAILVDPRRLQKLDEETQTYWRSKIEEQYATAN